MARKVNAPAADVPIVDQEGHYHIERRAKIEAFDIRSVAKAQDELNEFLADCSENGWTFQFFFDSPILFVLAVLDELIQDPPTNRKDTTRHE